MQTKVTYNDNLTADHFGSHFGVLLTPGSERIGLSPKSTSKKAKLLSNVFSLSVADLYLDLNSKSQSGIARYLVHQTLMVQPTP